jgi:hypothetical protein
MENEVFYNRDKMYENIPNQEKRLLKDVEDLRKIKVSYEQFGAKLDGVTDDTEAIRTAHMYANNNGYPVVQHNATFVLNGSVDVQTDVDLSGSTLITTWEDTAPIDYNRTSVLFNITGEKLEDVTSLVAKAEFTKGAIRVPSLGNIESGALIIKTTSLDLMRDNNGLSQINKQESNILLKNSQGDLMYPLTKDYSTATGFQVLLRKDEKKLTFKMPKVKLAADAKLYSIVKCYRNNVELTEATVEEDYELETGAPLYSVAEFTECSRIHISNVNCPIIGRETATGTNGLGYLFLFTRVANILIDKVYQISGWSSINGNWFRDVTVTNSSLVTIGGHVNTFDLRIDNSTIMKKVLAHGGGLLEVKNSTVDGRMSDVAIETRYDYAGEWDGVIRATNVKTLYSKTLVNINPVTYDCGRKVALPRVEIDNCVMENVGAYDTKFVNWKGYTGNFQSTLPEIVIKGGCRVKTGNKLHRTVELPETLTNTAISGKVLISIKDMTVPRESFESGFYSSSSANLIIPSITNSSVYLSIDIERSVANFQVAGTSNASVRVVNSEVYIIRAKSGATSITTVGDPLVLEFDNCKFHRPSCDLGSIANGRVQASVTNSKYFRFKKADGTYDNQIGFSFENIITYAKNNVAEVEGSLPASNASRLFDYMDATIWRTS